LPILLFVFQKKSFFFSYLFFPFVQNFKSEKRLVMTCVFECLQSHCHILKELLEFLHILSAITIFGEVLSYLILWLMDQ
jgi:hypothetical protein